MTKSGHQCTFCDGNNYKGCMSAATKIARNLTEGMAIGLFCESKYVCWSPKLEAQHRIDETKYIKQASIPCDYNKCEKYFNALKKKNN